ncbi:hypothetical protein WICPIJ_004255 [Wickerhamomyces pijperi]|uniref:Uncharacterized protein n=1 Tax=Wickerhamomyces pijperi TaxID=599730 RepID=A0A9P8Q694_WICPI|nr:hypothetical protein WICPIJ_004255 [Wickerhamomyces pijperi]
MVSDHQSREPGSDQLVVWLSLDAVVGSSTDCLGQHTLVPEHEEALAVVVVAAAVVVVVVVVAVVVVVVVVVVVDVAEVCWALEYDLAASAARYSGELVVVEVGTAAARRSGLETSESVQEKTGWFLLTETDSCSTLFGSETVVAFGTGYRHRLLKPMIHFVLVVVAVVEEENCGCFGFGSAVEETFGLMVVVVDSVSSVAVVVPGSSLAPALLIPAVKFL